MTEHEEEWKARARDLHGQVFQDLLSFDFRLEEAEGKNISDACIIPVNSAADSGVLRPPNRTHIIGKVIAP